MKKYLFFFLLLSTSYFSFGVGQGICQLTQNPDGTFYISCEGGTIIYEYETVTNLFAYEILNCEDLKRDLQNYLTSLIGNQDDDNWIEGVFSSIREYNNYLSYLASENQSAIDTLDSSSFTDDIYTYDSVKYNAEQILQTTSIIEDSINYAESEAYGLTNQINNIKCCTTNNPSGGSCSEPCDFSPVLDKLNTIIGYYNHITNKLNAVYEKLGGSSHLGYKYIDTDYRLNQNAGLRYFNWNSTKTPYINLLNLALHSQYNTAFGLASVNNYLHKLSFVELPYISTNLETLVIESTNFFSFFRGEIGVKGVLEDWDSDIGNYYDFLTNHYLTIMFNPSHLSGSESEKTNWFSRIETLLAALVFADSDGTNTVDDTKYDEERTRLMSSLDTINYTPQSRLDRFEIHSHSLLSSVRNFSSAFSNASLPSRVNLVSIGLSDSEMVYFETSEISPLIEACHCATTLIWCFSGLILLFWFIHYTFKASYNLVVFAWSVVSAVFGK